MTTNEFETQKQIFGIEGTGFDTITTKDREWKDKQSGIVVFSITAGSRVHVDFSPRTFAGKMWVTYNGETKMSRCVTAANWLKGFRKPPTIKTLQKYSWDGIAKTVTGCKTEPDGYGPDGSPSWMLVVGII